MDLKAFVGKNVMVQFQAGTSVVLATASKGRIAPLIQAGPDGQPRAAIAPCVDGTIEERPHGLVLVYGDAGADGASMCLSIAPELVAFVTEIGETRRIVKLS